MIEKDYDCLLALTEHVISKEAKDEDRLVYMEFMNDHGLITELQLARYIRGEFSDELLHGALTLGRVVLVGWLTSRILDKVIENGDI